MIQESEQSTFMKKVWTTIEEAKSSGVELGIAFTDLNNTKNTFLYHENDAFEVGSVIKLCILTEVLIGFDNKKIDLEQR
jgi:beta-lactamase class A